jgi:FKBP-type peptidyl-prolyl cis-trans isomerase (trigger factor)
MAFQFLKKEVLGFVLSFLFITGCSIFDNDTNKNYLVRIDKTAVTVEDYLDALEVMKASYPYEALQEKQVVDKLKTRLLKQLTEELILTKRAEELGLSISAAELENAVKEVKDDYPDGVFKKTLQERAIPFDAWQKRVAIRLLTEKVIDHELVIKISLSPEEVRRHFRACVPVDQEDEAYLSNKIDTSFVKQLRREKAQALYPQWMSGLQQQYDIELNEQQWEKIYK